MDGWNTSFLLGWPIFRGKLLVSGRVKGWQVLLELDLQLDQNGLGVYLPCDIGGSD